MNEGRKSRDTRLNVDSGAACLKVCTPADMPASHAAAQ
jgi:hypothetical protein